MKISQWAATAAVVITIILTAAACSGAPAGDSNISVKDAWARPSAALAPVATTDSSMSGMGNMTGTMTSTNALETGLNGPVSAAYMTIANTGGKADRLMSVTTSAANVAEVHETVSMDGGMMGMQPVKGGLEIPANGSVTLKPGGYHIMMMDLHQELVTGQTIKLSLKFQSGKQVDVDVPVKSITGQ